MTKREKDKAEKLLFEVLDDAGLRFCINDSGRMNELHKIENNKNNLGMSENMALALAIYRRVNKGNK